MEKKLSETYNTARDELTEEWQKFMRKQEPRVKKAYEDLQKALQTGDTQAIFDARVYYQRVLMNTTIQNNRYQNMVDDLTDKVARVNQTALDYINGNMSYIYTINYNEFATERIKGYSFSLLNENAVRELMITNKMLVPTKKKMDIPKDKRWNTKFINSQVTQGILQGESMQEIANRILPEITAKSDRPDLIKRNKAAAIRNARTMVTSAENAGRQDSYVKAESDGVIMEREWIAAHDARTRDWHREIDGIRVAVNQPWHNSIGDIMYPGDPTADPANVYNCRCGMRVHVKGFNWNKSEKASIKEEELIAGNIHGSELNTNQEKIDRVKEVMNVDNDKAKEYFETLNDYFTTGHRDIRSNPNGYQARLIEEYIDKSPKWKGGDTFRGLGLYKDQLAKIEIGQELDMKGIASWSSDKQVAIEYATRATTPQMVLFISDTQTLGTSVADVAKYYSEKEVLVSSKAMYKVVDKQVEEIEVWDDHSLSNVKRPIIIVKLKEVIK